MSICPSRGRASEKSVWLGVDGNLSWGSICRKPTTGAQSPSQRTPLCSYVFSNQKREDLFFQFLRTENQGRGGYVAEWGLKQRAQGTRALPILHRSALPPLSAPWAGQPPLLGSEVWVQSLLPGLGPPGHCDPSCFLHEAQPAYLLILPLISHSSTSPPPCSFKPGPRAPMGGGQSPAPHVHPPFLSASIWVAPGRPLTPGRHLLLRPRDFLGTSSNLAPSGTSGYLRQASVSSSVTWAEC